MSFETAADAFIRPTVARAATPAHGAQAGNSAAAPVQQTAWLSDGAHGERGAKAEHETAAGELSFYDLLDVINPLQHIPGVASAYRALTGDEIKAPAEILGSMLYGGPVGLVAGLANAIVKESSGKDIGEAALAMLFGEEPAANVAAAIPDQPAADALAGPALEAALQAEPAAGQEPETKSTAYLAVPGMLSDVPSALAEAELAAAPEAAVPDDAEAAAAAAAAAPVAPAQGATLTGKAALNAFLTDLATLGRSAEGGAPNRAAAPTGGEAAAAPAMANAEPRPSRKQGNLAGLGGRDKRASARPAGAAQPAAGTTAPRIVSGAAPRLPGAAPVDPTLFLPAETAEPAALTGAEGAAPVDFSGQMMRALQKYETLLQDKPAAGGDPS